MIKMFCATLVIVGLCVLLLAIKIILSKNGKFPNIHVGSNKAMRQRGIGCNVSQDREARKEKTTAIKEHI